MSRLVEDQDPYLLKVAKFVPVEVTVVYAAINKYLSDNAANLPILVLFGLLLLIACFFIIKFQTGSSLQATLTSFAFVIWAIAVSSVIYGSSDRFNPYYFSALAFVSLFLPRLSKLLAK